MTTITGKTATKADENNKTHPETHELASFLDRNELVNFKEFYEKFEQVEETTCGIGFIRGKFLQKCANKKVFALLYGFLNCMFAASFFHFNATLSTIEKRFKIPSLKIGMISAGNDICQILATIVLSYYAGKGHRPRWLAFGVYLLAVFCFLNSLTYFVYGEGEDVLVFTKEYASSNFTTNKQYQDSTMQRSLCQQESGQCEVNGSIGPQLMLFTAQIFAGISGLLFHTLGISYMDDNIKKSKSPALICFSLLFRMLGPALGYGLASYCLKIFINPALHPLINEKSPQWLGAYWIGWLVLAGIHIVTASLLGLFPKHLPRAFARKKYVESHKFLKESESETHAASFSDLLQTVKRIFTNPLQIINHTAAIFYYIGFLPYLMFLPKYLETVFKFSASSSSSTVGSIEMVFSSLGIIASGAFISKFKPKARVLARWNVLVGLCSFVLFIAFAFIGCPENERQMSSYSAPGGSMQSNWCKDCNCDYVKFSPVCAPHSNRMFISACHAGCTSFSDAGNHSEKYTNCTCVQSIETLGKVNSQENFVVPGACPVNCFSYLVMFLVGVSVLKFVNASGRAPNLLILVRSVQEKDKPVAMGLGLTIMSLFAFIPAPIIFGSVFDNSCLIWGKTCQSNGNCWIYDLKTQRYWVNFSAAGFTLIGTILDTFVWYYAKNLRIFDEEPKKIIKDSSLLSQR